MKVKIRNVITDPDLQARVKMNEDLIASLTDIYKDDGTIYGKPILAWRQEDGKWLVVDGHHRLEAAKRAGVDEINITVPFNSESFAGSYTRADALRDAIYSNSRQGQRLTRADITRAVGLLLDNDPGMDVEKISKIVCRSKSVVYECIKELSSSGKLDMPETRKGKDGKERPTKYVKKLERKTPESMDAEKVGKDAPEPAPAMVSCAGGCGALVSPIYLEDLKAEGRQKDDWLEADGAWYCSEECAAKADREQKRLATKSELEELVALFPCAKCGGVPSVQVNKFNGTARISCRECGNTHGFFDPPEKAVQTWKQAYTDSLARTDAEEGEDLFLEKQAPCPECGRTPNCHWVQTRWAVFCSGENHKFEVTADTVEDARKAWDKIFKEEK